MPELFDDWPDRYDQWFDTPMGRLIKEYESDLILRMLNPKPGETILDAGCGTGVFTADILENGATVVGLELAFRMLQRAQKCVGGRDFGPIQGDMLKLPFNDESFDKSVSITAIEFIEDAQTAVDEMFRVTKPGGTIVIATLNAMSPWAERRQQAAKNGHPLFEHTIFRSLQKLRGLSPVDGITETAIHFLKDEDPQVARQVERAGREQHPDTGAFAVVRWIKPM